MMRSFFLRLLGPVVRFLVDAVSNELQKRVNGQK